MAGLSPSAQRVIDAVLAGDAYTEPGPISADTTMIPGTVIRDLILGAHGSLRDPRIRVHGVLIDGDIDLRHREWRGELDLSQSHILGILRLDHSRLHGRVTLDGTQIRGVSASYMHLEGPFLFREGFAAEGMYALAAEISGSLNLRKTILWAPRRRENRCALELFRAHIGDVFLTLTELHGGLYGNGIHTERNIRLQGSLVRSRAAMGWPDGPDSAAGAVSLTGARVGGALYLSWKDFGKTATRIEGRIVLNRMTCTSIRVEPSHLATADISVDHFSYTRLLGVEPEDWLAALERAQPLATEPYARLAEHCALIGRADLQRTVFIRLQQRLTAALPERSLYRLRRRLYGWAVQYGYGPGRAVGWLGLVAVLCTAVLLIGGDFLVLQAENGESGARGVHRGIDAAVVAMDNLLPFAGLGVAKQWVAEPETGAQLFWLTLFVFLKFAAWGLAAVGLASVTGLIRR